MPDILCTGLIVSHDQNLAVRLPDKARLVAVPSNRKWASCGRCRAQGFPGCGGCRVRTQAPFRACSHDIRRDGRNIFWAYYTDEVKQNQTSPSQRGWVRERS